MKPKVVIIPDKYPINNTHPGIINASDTEPIAIAPEIAEHPIILMSN